MRQKKVKRLRKEAIKVIEEMSNKTKFASADYSKATWSNPYKNFIKHFRSDI